MRVSMKLNQESKSSVACASLLSALVLMLPVYSNAPAGAQEPSGQKATNGTTEQRVEQLTAALAKAEAQMSEYQAQLLELRTQLSAVQLQMAADALTKSASKANQINSADENTKAENSATRSESSIEEIRERQAMDESQIATHEVTKVESLSKYPIKLSGLILFNGFVNTRQVDVSASPAYAIEGPGSTGLSLRQTVLGFDARGPHLFGAISRADLRVDFFANGAQTNYAASGLLRLRTAHAMIDWGKTQSFVEFDRPILEPNSPSSLVAIAQPELAWAGNLWNWSPQVGVAHQFWLSDATRITAQVSLIDTSDPLPSLIGATPPATTQTERSRWPGSEVRVALIHGPDDSRTEVGVGGYFSSHRTSYNGSFNAWAVTADARFPLSRYFEITTNAYRGQALAGLGGGGYVNYYLTSNLNQVANALDDVGGWAQLKTKLSQRVEINNGFGTDNPFAKEIDAAASAPQAVTYPGLERNRSFYSNVIYSPSAYIQFSMEYKRLWSSYVGNATYRSDSIGLGAGYRF